MEKSSFDFPEFAPPEATKILDPKFFRGSTLRVSRQLLGKVLVRRLGSRLIRSYITEVEAYDGFHDKASHAAVWIRREHRGRKGSEGRERTHRSLVMFGPAGRFYVYLCYGVHWMLNVVTREAGYPAAILIRGCTTSSGPGRLTKRLRINRALNEKLCHPDSGLWVEDHGVRVSSREIIQTPRVGVDYAGSVWAKKPWRFVWKPSSQSASKSSTD